MNDDMNRNDYDDFVPPPEQDKPVFYDENNYTDFKKAKQGGKLLSTLSFIISLIAMFYMCGGFAIVGAAVGAVGLITGIIAILRKSMRMGLAVAGAIISGMVAVVCLWAYFSDSAEFAARRTRTTRIENGRDYEAAVMTDKE